MHHSDQIPADTPRVCHAGRTNSSEPAARHDFTTTDSAYLELVFRNRQLEALRPKVNHRQGIADLGRSTSWLTQRSPQVLFLSQG